MTEPIRYHEDNGLPLVYEGGAYRVLAALPGRAAYAAAPAWADSKPVLPRNQWRPVSLRGYPIPILDQAQSSACVGHATASAFRRAWLRSGQPDRPFNPYWAYGLINHDQDAGAIVGDAVDAIARFGFACDGEPANGDLPHRLFMQTQVMGMAVVLAKAARFRVLECWHLRGPGVFDQMATALQEGYACVSGLTVGRNFGQLDAEGVAPLPDVVLGGHALEHCGLAWSARRGAWLLDTDNSWSLDWGDQGTCRLEEGHWGRGTADAFALKAVRIDPEDAWPEARAA